MSCRACHAVEASDCGYPGLEERPDGCLKLVSTPIGNVRVETNHLSEPGAFRLLSELLQDVPAEPDWLLRGYVAAGAVTLLGGRPKVGKSTLMWRLLAALEAGSPFLGLPTKATSALLLTEENPSTLAAKLAAVPLARARGLMRTTAAGRTFPEVMASAVEVARETRSGLIVVDTFAAWGGLDDENDASAVLEALRPVQQAAAIGLAVLVVVHQRKSGGTHGDAVRGSNALTGAVDVILELERMPGMVADRRKLAAVSRYPSTPDELVIALTDTGYEVFGDAQEAAERDEQNLIRQALEDAGPSTVDEISAIVEMPPSTVRKRLERMNVPSSGTGKRNDARRYSLTELVSTQPSLLGAETKSGVPA